MTHRKPFQPHAGSPRRSARLAFALAAGQRSAPRSRCRKKRERPRQRVRRRRGVRPRTRARCRCNPAGMSKLDAAGRVLAMHLITPSIKFKDDGSQAAAFQPLGGTGGDAGSTAVVPNLYFVVPINNAMGVRPRHQRAVRPRRPNTTTTGSAASRASSPTSRRSTSIRRCRGRSTTSYRARRSASTGSAIDADVHEQGQLLGRPGAGGAGRRPRSGLIPRVARAGDHRRHARARVERHASTATTARGAGTSACCGTSTPQTRVGVALPLVDQVQRDRQRRASTIPTLPALPPPLAPVVGQLAGSSQHAQLANGGVTSNIELPDIANVSIFQSLRRPLGPDGRRAVDAVVDASRTCTFVRTTRQPCCRPRRRTSTTRGASRSARTTATTTVDVPRRPRVGPDAGQHDRPHARGCPTRIATGSPSARNTSSTATRASTAASRTSWSNKPDINQNAGSTAANGLVKGSYDANVTDLRAQLDYTF